MDLPLKKNPTLPSSLMTTYPETHTRAPRKCLEEKPGDLKLVVRQKQSRDLRTWLCQLTVSRWKPVEGGALVFFDTTILPEPAETKNMMLSPL